MYINLVLLAAFAFETDETSRNLLQSHRDVDYGHYKHPLTYGTAVIPFSN